MFCDDLVSVVVVTYNSGKTILETLESVKNQSYKCIELIISDDCSTDDTKEKCESWLLSNANRFKNSKYLESNVNTGVCGNLNRGINLSRGKWIKGLAADDLLKEDAIEEYLRFCFNNNCHVCVSDASFIDDDGNTVSSESKTSIWTTFLNVMGKDINTQKKQVQLDKLCPGPPMIFDREIWEVSGGYDEKYSFADEWVMQYHIVMKGYMIYPLHKRLMQYRVSQNSLCHSSDNRSNASQLSFAKDIVIPALCKQFKFVLAWDVYIRRIVPFLMGKHSNLNYRYFLLLSPLYIYSRITNKRHLYWPNKLTHCL